MSLPHESKDGAEQPNTSRNQIGALEIMVEFRILNEFKDIEDLCVYLFNHEVETWVYARDITKGNIVAMCSIKQDGFRRLQIKSNVGIRPTFTYCSIHQKSIMFVATSNGGFTPWYTRIWTDLNFDKEINEEPPIELNDSQGLCFSDCGSYFLAWSYREHLENAMEFYDVRLFKSTREPSASISIGRDVLRARGQIVQVDQASIEVLGIARSEGSLIAAFLVTSSSKVELTLWEISLNEVFKKINLTMKEVISLLNESVESIHTILDDFFRSLSR